MYPAGRKDEYIGQQHPIVLYLYVIPYTGFASGTLPDYGVLAGNEKARPPVRAPNRLGFVSR